MARWRERLGREWRRLLLGSGGLRVGGVPPFCAGIELAKFISYAAPLPSFPPLGADLDELSLSALSSVSRGVYLGLLVTGIAASLERRRVDHYGPPASPGLCLVFLRKERRRAAGAGFVAGGMIVTGATKVMGWPGRKRSALFGLTGLGATALAGV